MNNNLDGVYISEALNIVVDQIEKSFESDNCCPEISTGFKHLDRMTCGLHRGDLVIIGGRPSMGKTILATNILEYVCIKQEMPSLIFNLEMSYRQLTMRMIASIGRIDMQRIRSSQLNDEDWPRLSAAIETLSSTKIKIKSGPVSLDKIIEISRAFKNEHSGMGVIVIDHIHLIECEERQNVHEELADVTRSLKNLALELNIPVIITSALNRNLELRTDRKPLLNDLRGSGSLEDDADIVLMLYKPNVYDRSSTDPFELRIVKNRNGPIGTIPLNAPLHYLRFENYRYESDSSSCETANNSLAKET